jgi:hypothetical protein
MNNELHYLILLYDYHITNSQRLPNMVLESGGEDGIYTHCECI